VAALNRKSSDRRDRSQSRDRRRANQRSQPFQLFLTDSKKIAVVCIST
jgi:hypothetical protein